MSNVLINHRPCVHRGSEQQVITQDVCYTTIHYIAIAYTNVAKSSSAINTARDVFINNHPACHQGSQFANSRGDEAGTYRGIHSATIEGRAEFLTGSSNVFIEGQPAVRSGDLMISNNRNSNIAPLS